MRIARQALALVGVLLLLAAAAAGIWAIVQRFEQGMKVTNLTSNMAWGMWVVYYIYCIGLSAGSFLLSTLVYVFDWKRFEKIGRLALVSAVFALFGGLLFVWIDLGHPWRFWKMFTGFQPSSVMAWECVLYIFYMACICGELWLLMRCDLDRLAQQSGALLRPIYRALSLGWKCPPTAEELAACHAQTARWVKVLGMLGIPLAISVHGGTGALFAVVAAKPYWFSGLFPIIFLISALLSGCGLMMFLYGFWGPRDEDYLPILYGLRNLMIGLIVVDALMFLSDLLVGLYGNVPLHVMVLYVIILGDYWYVFWLGQIGLAWVLPAVIGWLPGTRNRAGWLSFAGLAVVIGIVAVRMNLVIPAYLHPQLPGLRTAYQQPRLAYEYFPSMLEWVSSHGLFALGALLFIITWRLLPLFGSEPIEAEAASHG